MQNNEIKIGSIFVREVDSDDGQGWSIYYTVIKVTAKTVTVTDNRWEQGHHHYEPITRRLKMGYNGKPAIAVRKYGNLAYLAE
ncbi:MAG: hypothetical protein ACK528_09705 [Alphaproteobacteria bacterium]|jgi:hypothetical protein